MNTSTNHPIGQEDVGEIERLRVELAEADAWIHEATKTITNLTGGGSENFGRCVRDIYRADLPFCSQRIRERFERVSLALRSPSREGVVPEELRKAAEAIVQQRFSTYKARNGRDVGIEDSSGEKCWIVPFDAMFELERALAATPVSETPPADADVIAALREVQRAVFGDGPGSEPDVYADYDKLCELAGKFEAVLTRLEASQPASFQSLPGGTAHDPADQSREEAIQATPPRDLAAAPGGGAEQGPFGKRAVEWRDMDTAPRDGTEIVLAFGQDGISQGWYDQDLDHPHPWCFIDTDGPRRFINRARDDKYGPTHWQPMPEWFAPAASPVPDTPPADAGLVEALTPLQLQLLREINGDLPASPWGAWVGVCLEALRGHELIDRQGKITEAGRTALSRATGGQHV